MYYLNSAFFEMKRWHKVIIFAFVLFIILFLDFLNSHPFVFYYDSEAYWNLSQIFLRQNGFSFLNFNHETRGYLFPFIIFCVRELARWAKLPEDIVYVSFMALVYTTFLVVWIPEIVRRFFGTEVKSFGVIVFSAITILFWHSVMFYPLSDLLPIVFIVVSALLMIGRRNLYGQIIAGALIGGTCLVRPVYIASLPFFVLWLAVYYYREVNLPIKNIVSSFLLFFLGLLVICFPQYEINLYHFDIRSPFVKSEIGGTNLYSAQLRWGIAIQKFEGNIDLLSYPRAGVYFLDPHGKGILVKEGISLGPTSKGDEILPLEPVSLREYVKLVLKYPLDFLFIYARHLFNGLDIVYSSVYNDEVYANGIIFRMINYSVWYLVLAYIFFVFKGVKINKLTDSRYIFLMAFFLPSILSIPTVIEPRFMLPVQFAAYALVAFGVLPIVLTRDIAWLYGVLRRYFPWYLFFIGVCFSFSLNTYLDLQFGTYLLSR